MTERRYRVSVDTGGTFTDVVISDDAGRMTVGKALTTAERVFDGLRAAIEAAAAPWDLDAEAVLGATDVMVYGTTHATNAVVTGRTARTALITTAGFEDTLHFREGGRIGAFDSHAEYPGPYVPRRLTFGVEERVSAEGTVLTPLSEASLAEAVAAVGRARAEAVGVMLLWSIANPAHELRVGAALAESFPDLPVSLSHQVNPILREYRRASSACIDASLKPLMRRHFEGLSRDLAAAGFRGQCLVATSEGGVQDIASVAARPLLAVNSGPSMAPIAGASFAAEAAEVVVCDIGGTTFDVSVVEGGRLRHTRELWLGEPFTGELSGLASVKVRNVGAGGGSIARVDAGGLITVGPDSAGAFPGPAAYGRGGEAPTVTDAAVVLGYLDPEALAGVLTLAPSRAEAAVLAGVGAPLGLGAAEAASAILKVAVTRSAGAARRAILEEGVDPRGVTLVACGGAGPLLGCLMAEELEAREVVAPANAGVLAAYGAHNADVLTEFTRAARVSSRDADLSALAAALAGLEADSRTFAARFEGTATGASVEWFAEARYPAQAWELRLPLGPSFAAAASEIARAAAGFHEEHRRRNGACDPASEVEFLAWGARVAVAREPRRPRARTGEGAGAPRPGRAVFGGRAVETPRHRGAALAAGWTAQGPVIVDETTTTLVVPPGWTVRLRPDGAYVMTRAAGAAA